MNLAQILSGPQNGSKAVPIGGAVGLAEPVGPAATAAKAVNMLKGSGGNPTSATSIPAADVGKTPQGGNSYLTQGNEYSAKAASILNGATPYNPETDPLYASAKLSASRNAQQASSRSQAEMNRRGILDSTITTDRDARIQQEAEQGVTDLIPSLAANYQANQQNQFQNYSQMANTMLNAGQNEQNRLDSNSHYDLSRGDQNSQFDKSFGLNQSAVTGSYQNPDAQKAIQTILGLKQQAETPGISGQDLSGLSGQANSARDILSSLGIDPKLFGSGVSYADASKNAANIKGAPTVDTQRMLLDTILGTGNSYGSIAKGAGDILGGLPAYSSLEGLIKGLEGKENLNKQAQNTDELYKAENLKLDKKQVDISSRNAGTSAASQSNSATNAAQGRLMDIWQATGKAPKGIPGVAEGTPIYEKPASIKPVVPESAEEYSKYLDGIAKYEDDTTTGGRKLSNPDDVMNAIELSDMSEYEKYKAYKARGLNWDDPIPSK